MNKKLEILDRLDNVKIVGLEEYSLRNILFTEVCNSFDKKYGFKHILSNICFNHFQFALKKHGSKLLFVSYDYQRSDHNEMIQKYRRLFECDDMYLSAKSVKKNGIQNSFSNIIVSILKFRRIYKNLNIDIDKNQKVHLSCCLLNVLRLKEILENADFHYKVMIQYFDGGLYENTLVQFCKCHNIKTITLQHGQPVFHGKEVDLLNQTMMLNFSSDYFIATGEFTKKQLLLAGVSEDRIKICGSLRTIIPLDKILHRKFIVLLDCPTYSSSDKSNQELIDIACKISNQYNYTFTIKCHPQDNSKKYERVVTEKGTILEEKIAISDALIGMDFALLHISGAYLDAMSAGVKPFCLVNESSFPLVEEENDMFFNIEDLTRKIKWWIESDYKEKQDYIDKTLAYYLSPQNASERNKIFVEKLLGDE